MTSQQIADEALAIHQANRSASFAVLDSLFSEFFNRLSQSEYDEVQSCVTEIFSAKPIFLSDLPCHLSEAL